LKVPQRQEASRRSWSSRSAAVAPITNSLRAPIERVASASAVTEALLIDGHRGVEDLLFHTLRLKRLCVDALDTASSPQDPPVAKSSDPVETGRPRQVTFPFFGPRDLTGGSQRQPVELGFHRWR
jgi:hypothetical protein